MNDKREKTVYRAAACVLALCIGIFALLGVKYLLPAVLPFLFAWGIAFATRKPADFISNKCGISRAFVRPILSVLLMLITVGGGISALIRISTEAWQLFSELGESGELAAIAELLLDPLGAILEDLGIPDGLKDGLADAMSGIFTGIVGKVAGIVTSIVSALPKIILFIVITAISAAYFSIDLERINNVVLSVLPDKASEFVKRMKSRLSLIAVKYVRSYFILMVITFSVILIGLMLMRVRYALLMAFIIALLDALPVIGIGIVLVPWGIWSLIVGKTGLGIGLLVLYAASAIIRQVAEPRIVGKSLGIHPLLTLLFMYVGYTLFGIAGLIFLPAAAVIITTTFGKDDAAEIKEGSTGLSE
ncbi:MAG: sporulation integral membrane protein YtvI [Ruminococcaceae bacterium]|nr:sporulation integral membrane protein YtvI [Oscillospiraceae bacterium]